MEVEPNGSGAAILSDLMAMMTPVADMKHAEPQPRRVYADVQQKTKPYGRIARCTDACHQGSTPTSPVPLATSAACSPLRLSKMVLRAYSSKISEVIQWHPSQSGKNVCSYHLHFMHATSEQSMPVKPPIASSSFNLPLPPECHRRTICIRLGGEVGDSQPSAMPCSETGYHPRSLEPRLLPSERQRRISALRLLPPRLTECRPMFSWPFSPLI